MKKFFLLAIAVLFTVISAYSQCYTITDFDKNVNVSLNAWVPAVWSNTDSDPTSILLGNGVGHFIGDGTTAYVNAQGSFSGMEQSNFISVFSQKNSQLKLRVYIVGGTFQANEQVQIVFAQKALATSGSYYDPDQIAINLPVTVSDKWVEVAVPITGVANNLYDYLHIWTNNIDKGTKAEFYIDDIQICPADPTTEILNGITSNDGTQLELMFNRDMAAPTDLSQIEVSVDGFLTKVNDIQVSKSNPAVLILFLNDPIKTQSQVIEVAGGGVDSKLFSADNIQVQKFQINIANTLGTQVISGWRDDFNSDTDDVTLQISGGKNFEILEDAKSGVLTTTIKGGFYDDLWQSLNITTFSNGTGALLNLTGNENVEIRYRVVSSNSKTGIIRTIFQDQTTGRMSDVTPFSSLDLSGNWVTAEFMLDNYFESKYGMDPGMLDRSTIVEVLFGIYEAEGDVTTNYSPLLFDGTIEFDYISIGNAIVFSSLPNTILPKETITSSVNVNSTVFMVPVGTNLSYDSFKNAVNNKTAVMIDVTANTSFELMTVDLPSGEYEIYAYNSKTGYFSQKHNVTIIIPVTGISLDRTKLELLTTDPAITLGTQILPANATNLNVVWSSSDNSIATVSQTGVVTPISAGNVSIKVATQDGGYIATCDVTVIKEQIAVASISLNYSKYTLPLNQQFSLIETVLPTNASDKSVVWVSNDNTIVTVDSKGVVSAVSEGETFITVTTVDGGYSAKCVVTVKKIDQLLIFDAENKNLTNFGGVCASFNDSGAGGASIVTPYADNGIEFTMSTPGADNTGNAAMIDFKLDKGTLSFSPFVGMLTIINQDNSAFDFTGSTGVQFTYKSDVAFDFQAKIKSITDDCNFYKTIPAASDWTKITINWNDLTQYTWGKSVAWDESLVTEFLFFIQGSTGTSGQLWVDDIFVNDFKLNVNVSLLETAITKAISLHDNSNEGNAVGEYPVGSKAILQAEIDIAKSVYNTASTQVKIDEAIVDLETAMTVFQNLIIESVPVTGVILDQTTLSLQLSDASQILIETIIPNDATDKTVVWTSSNSKIVEVANGIVTAVSVGSAVITVTTTEGNYEASCIVTVSPLLVSSITLLPTTINFKEGDPAVSLTATMLPVNATDISVIWSSSNEKVATVQNGVVTPVADGTCLVTATTTDGSKLSASCNVTVDSAPITITSQIKDITVTTADLIGGYSFGKLFSYTGKGSVVYSVKSSNSAVVQVVTTTDGFMLFQIGQGIAEITVTAKVSATNMVSQTFNVTVESTSGVTCNGLTINADIKNVDCIGDQTGAITVQVSGGTAPFKYKWSNSRSDNAIANVPAGLYSVIITDANDCSEKREYTITSPSKVQVVSNLTSPECNQNTGEITITTSGGTAPLSLLWNTGSTANSLTSLEPGIYELTVTDAKNCKSTFKYELNNSTAPEITLDTVVASMCNSNSGVISVSVSGGTLPYDFTWSDNAKTEDRFSLAPGIYNLKVTDGNGCVVSYATEIPLITPQENPMCVVTVDTLTGKNLIVWETKEEGNKVNFYSIYVEKSVLGKFELVDEVTFNEAGTYLDLNANPQIRSWRYRISATDHCGNETAMSDAHKTIHLQKNLGLSGEVNLDWDFYEGIDVASFYVFRITKSNPEELIETLPGNVLSYTDINPPADVLGYYVAIDLPAECDPYGLSQQALKAESGPYSLAMSNIAEVEGATGIDALGFETKVSLYPNPAHSSIEVSVNGVNESEYIIEIINVIGVVVESKTVKASSFKKTISLDKAQSGMYYVQVTSVKGTSTIPFIVEK